MVASEVRKLAERSQRAASEINKLSVSSVFIAEKAALSQVPRALRKSSEKNAESQIDMGKNDDWDEAFEKY